MATLLTLGLVMLLAGGLLEYGQWRFDQVPKVHVLGLTPAPRSTPKAPSQAFNILSIGSDSRAGLSGSVAAQTGAGSVSGSRSDVVKIIHVDPSVPSVTILSIPRDTMVSLLANQSLFTNYNRINVNYGNGPSLLVRTITANFGIPISHVIQVSFGGIINTADAIGGVYLNFPYPAKDAYSGLNITHAGCQLVTGFQALAIARSRHYQYLQNGVWMYDGTSDYGRIVRQNVFVEALLKRAEHSYNPLTVNTLLSNLPQGITIDDRLTLSDLVGLAYRFRHFSPSVIKTYTLPTISTGYVAPYGDVLFPNPSADYALLRQIFGNSLLTPTNPPPSPRLVPTWPSVTTTTTTSQPVATTTTITPPTTTPSTTVASRPTQTTPSTTSTTTTTIPTSQLSYFDPTVC